MLWHRETIPQQQTIINFLKSQVDWNKITKQKPKFIPNLRANITIDHENILKEIFELYREVEAISWRSVNSISLYGLSLTYNPYQDREEWKQGSFGHSRYKQFSKSEYYKAVSNDKINHVKNDYLDSYGFTNILPQIYNKPHLLKLLTSFKLPVIRVTARTLNGRLTFPTTETNGGWHVDDSPHEVLRINISLNNDGNFGLQYKGQDPIYTEAGNNIVVNTDIEHRAYIKSTTNLQRTNLIIGLAPYFHYENDCWSVNDYFGNKHPYDLVVEHLI